MVMSRIGSIERVLIPLRSTSRLKCDILDPVLKKISSEGKRRNSHSAGKVEEGVHLQSYTPYFRNYTE
jgi:hypothetical protein